MTLEWCIKAYLIVYRSKVYICFHRLAGDTAGKHVLPSVAKPVIDKNS